MHDRQFRNYTLLACLHATVRSGKPPTVGGGALQMPSQGAVINVSLTLADRVDEDALVRGRGVMVMAAALLGDRARAVRWGQPVWDQLVAAGGALAPLVLPLLVDPLSAAALLERKYARALTVLHQGVAAAKAGAANLDPVHVVVHLGIAAAVLAMMWDEAEGRTVRAEVLGQLRSVRGVIGAGGGPDAAARWAAYDGLVSLVEERPGWRPTYETVLANDVGPAKYLVASLEGDAEPSAAATLQVLALFALAPALSTSPALVSTVVVPAVVAYWKALAAREGFRLRSPAHLIRVLNRVATNDLASLRAVLEEVVDATAAQIPGPAMAWVREG